MASSTVLVAHSDFAIYKHPWLRPTVNQVSVALIVSADACINGIQGSSLTDDLNIVKRSTELFIVDF